MTDSSAGGNLAQNEVGDLFGLIVSEAWKVHSWKCKLHYIVIQLGKSVSLNIFMCKHLKFFFSVGK